MVYLWFSYGLPEGITHQHSDFFMAQLAAACCSTSRKTAKAPDLGSSSGTTSEIREMGEQWEDHSPKHAKSTTYVNTYIYIKIIILMLAPD